MEVNTKNTLSASFLWTEIRFPRPNIWQFLTEIEERAKEKLCGEFPQREKYS